MGSFIYLPDSIFLLEKPFNLMPLTWKEKYHIIHYIVTTGTLYSIVIAMTSISVIDNI